MLNKLTSSIVSQSLLKNKQINIVSALGVAAMFLCTSSLSLASEEVNVYSARKEKLIKPALNDFTKATGIKVNLVTGKADALLKRVQSEGKFTPADVLLTTDAGRLERAKQAKILQSINSSSLNSKVPIFLRDKDKQWFGLSARSRVIVYNKKRVKANQLSTYEDLAHPKWKGRLCMRSSSNIYNQSLMASMIAKHGEAYALKWAKGIVENLARPPKGNDSSQMKSVAVGECDVTLVNSYYYGAFQKSRDPSNRKLSKKLKLFYPNQKDRGTHMNVSGAGVTKYAKNKDNAIKLIEFLATKEAQKFYANVNYEYPVVSGVPVNKTVKSWGYPFKMDKLQMNKLGKYNSNAVKVFDKAGWK